MLTPTRDRGRCRRRGRPARGSESAKQENIFIQKYNIYLLMIQKSEQKNSSYHRKYFKFLF